MSDEVKKFTLPANANEAEMHVNELRTILTVERARRDTYIKALRAVSMMDCTNAAEILRESIEVDAESESERKQARDILRKEGLTTREAGEAWKLLVDLRNRAYKTVQRYEQQLRDAETEG